MRTGCPRAGIKDGGQGTDTASTDIGALIPASDIPSTATGVLVIDLAAITRNYRMLREVAAPAECAGVVKADAYGLGMAHVAPALFAEGCRTFFVATFAEAETLRALLPDAIIYALNGLFPGTAEDFARANVQPVLGSMAEIADWKAFCRARGAPLPAALHIDTGMNRLGLKYYECAAIRANGNILDDVPVSLIMSHLACADTGHIMNTEQCRNFGALSWAIRADLPDHSMVMHQPEAFCARAAEAPHVPLSLANSAGILSGPDYHFDLVRPGIALYGGNPFSGHSNPMAPVVHLYGRIAAIGEADAGATVGYGASRTLTRRTRYVTVTAGYADGYFRTLGSADGREGAAAYIGEHRLPILGRVSMDLIVFDATDVPEACLARGGFVELIGTRFTVDDAAACAGTIGYEVLTSLGPRYHHVYIGNKRGDEGCK